MPHVLVLPSWYPEKAGDINGNFFRDQAISLKKRGFQVGVVSVHLTPLKKIFSLKKFALLEECDQGINTFRFYGVDLFPNKLPILTPRVYRKYGLCLFKKYLSKFGKPDILHVQSMLPAGYMALEISEKYSIPYIVTEHNSVFNEDVLSSKQIQDARLVAERSRKCFAVSTPFAQVMEKELGCPDKWHVMPNIVNDSFFEGGIPPPEGKTMFLSVCLLVPDKGVDILLKAFHLAFKEEDIVLEIGGDGPCMAELKKLCCRLGIEDKVKFLGMLTREQVRERMRACRVFVSASKYETFGVSIAEAMALGKPVIATRSGGPEEIVREEDGLLVSVGDVKEMAAAMRRMASHLNKYSPAAIRGSCKLRFSEEAVFKDVWQKI